MYVCLRWNKTTTAVILKEDGHQKARRLQQEVQLVWVATGINDKMQKWKKHVLSNAKMSWEVGGGQTSIQIQRSIHHAAAAESSQRW